jgi:AcrR family transcriptional regulator
MAGKFDAFHALEPEKQKRIIDAALTEFADKGFKRASTNAIADAAQIGKGMLFYYFGSKEELFNFLCEYTLEFSRNAFLARFKVDTGDFLERYEKLIAIKHEAMDEYPPAVAFFESFYKAGNEVYFAKYVEDSNALLAEVLATLYEGIDYSLFRGDIDGKSTIRYIKWLFDAYQDEISERFKRGELSTADDEAMDAEWKYFAEFCADLRKLFYKEGK